MENQPIIEVVLCKLNKIFNSFRRIFFEELDLHHAFFGVDLGYFHFDCELSRENTQIGINVVYLRKFVASAHPQSLKGQRAMARQLAGSEGE
jgi:hypothetical protein